MLNQPLRRLIEHDKTVTVPPQASVHDVAGLMLERAVGAVMVVDNGVLAFNRSDAVTFGGLVSGSGQLRQIGSGTTTLTISFTLTAHARMPGGIVAASPPPAPAAASRLSITGSPS